MPTPFNNPNMARGNSNLSAARSPNPLRAPKSREGDLTSLPVTPGVSQKRPQPTKEVPMLGVPEPALAAPTDPSGRNSNAAPVPLTNPITAIVIETPVQTDTVNTENQSDQQKRKKKKANQTENGDYSDDFDTADDTEDPINMVRDATFRYNQDEFERKMRALSAESNLPEVNNEEYEQCLWARQQKLSDRQTQHEDWLEAFKQKKTNILERLGIMVKNRSSRFHEVCDLYALTPRRGGNHLRKSKEWPEIIDVGEQLRQEHGID